MKTKQEQKDEAWEVYKAIVAPAEKIFRAIRDLAREAYLVIATPAEEALDARMYEIIEQPEPLKVDKEL